MPERFLDREIRESSSPQNSPDKPAPMQAQVVFEGPAIPKWKWQNDRARRTIRMSR